MKYYIIDLGLECGLRIKLAVSNMNQLGTKKTERERHFGHFTRSPYFSSRCPQPPHFTTSHSLSASPSSSSSSHHTRGSKAQISSWFSLPSLPRLPMRPLPQTSHHLVLKLVRTGKNPPHFRWVAPRIEAQTRAQVWPCNFTLSCFNFL